ncbi:MAG: PD40 domain-containing protein [Lentisphaeria bacterium]|nr:PD40 domain-containing protein [Lentisphaeria bacterium]
MFKLFVLFIFASAVLLPQTLCGAPVQVIKKVRNNPTLHMGSPAGESAFHSALRSFLRASGWFDLTDDPKADYTLKTRAADGKLHLTVEMGGVPVGSWNITLSRSPRDLAARTADAIIEKCFSALKVRGFCRSKIVFCANTAPGVRNLYMCDIDGKNQEQLTHYKTLCVEPAWSSSGKSVIFSRYNRSGIQVIETTVGTPRRSRVLSSFRGINTGAAPSPDGKRLAVILSPDHRVDLYVLTFGSPHPRRLTRGIAVEASPAWSPNGHKLVYVSDVSGRPHLYICNYNGSGKMKLPSIGSDAVTPDWSTDDKIVYATRINGTYTLAVLDLKTGKNTRVTEVPGSYESPTWAADNRQIVCKRDAGGRSELCVVDTWTGKVRRLLSTSYPLSMPVWSPCPVR